MDATEGREKKGHGGGDYMAAIVLRLWDEGEVVYDKLAMQGRRRLMTGRRPDPAARRAAGREYACRAKGPVPCAMTSSEARYLTASM